MAEKLQNDGIFGYVYFGNMCLRKNLIREFAEITMFFDAEYCLFKWLSYKL